MNLSKEQSEALEEMAYLLIPTNLIAINLEIDEIDFKLEMRDPESPVYKAFSGACKGGRVEIGLWTSLLIWIILSFIGILIWSTIHL